MPEWIERAIYYHVYPIGLLGAPLTNDLSRPVAHHLRDLEPWIDHLITLGCNAVYLGPVFESVSHGYDTIDYMTVDRRIGDNEDLRSLVAYAHDRGVRVILDGVFNHVSRLFPAFRDLQEHGRESAYRDWFVDVDFEQESPYGDPFSYYAYEGNFDLVKLNLGNDGVREHLFDVARRWLGEFGADGIRFDAVEQLDDDFVRDFVAVCRKANPDCWLLGEALGGDYRKLAGPGLLDSCTNYEAYKGLWSSFNDRNMHEIGWSLNRQFGPDGIYRDLLLYGFADNHDVNRIASQLTREEDLGPLYTMLYTIPGVPSIYYGSEWGIEGVKAGPDDSGLRPALDLDTCSAGAPQPWLPEFLGRLATIRQESEAIRFGDYQQLYVTNEQLAFARRAGDDIAVVAINVGDSDVTLDLQVGMPDGRMFRDAFGELTERVRADGRMSVRIEPGTSRILLSSPPGC